MKIREVWFRPAESAHAECVQSLATCDDRFSAYGNTMAAIERKTGKAPAPLEGVQEVEAGVARIMELHEQTYSYVSP